ncbi:DUF6234 family protein [Streptomyces sp. NPDC093970]|uniref:DUF6234 family protein n=1 Tax=Streptomyces sp. NPDC093970 TaxID=3155076 RepID=UPI00342C9C1D
MRLLADVGLAVVLSALEAVVLAWFWFAEGLRQWAAKGQSVPDSTNRYLVVLGAASTCSAAIAYGSSRADLIVACTAQAVMAVLLATLLVLIAGRACGQRIRRNRKRRRLHRERLRRYASQSEGGAQQTGTVRRYRRPR